MAKRKQSKKQLIQFVTQYGIHIWAILIIANAALVYAYNFTTHAATNSDLPLHALNISQAPSPSVSPSESPSPLPSTGPLGPTLNLTFTVPGIGSGGGVLKPLHTQRSVTVFLFSPNVNSMDPVVKPLYTIQGSALYDSNPASPTYTSFINPVLDLGSDVKDGDYQIAFRTDQSLRTLIKQNPTDLGGETFTLTKGNSPLSIPSQTVLMGDIIPTQGDNKVDINDYNAFINCYGENSTTNTFCKGHNYGDFNDDGVVDGIDYNILLRSLYALSQEGIAAPQVTPVPTIIIHKITPTRIPRPTLPIRKVTKAASPSGVVQQTKTPSKGGSALGIIFFLFFLILLGAGGFFLYMKNDILREKINALIHLSPTGTPAGETTEAPETEEAPAEETAETAAEETPQEEAPAEQSQPAQPETPPAQPPAPAQNAEAADYYIKKKGPDESGQGFWLTLTGDNGAIEGHYAKGDVTEGFAKIKGEMKTENGKTFLEISEISAEE